MTCYIVAYVKTIRNKSEIIQGRLDTQKINTRTSTRQITKSFYFDFVSKSCNFFFNCVFIQQISNAENITILRELIYHHSFTMMKKGNVKSHYTKINRIIKKIESKICRDYYFNSQDFSSLRVQLYFEVLNRGFSSFYFHFHQSPLRFGKTTGMENQGIHANWRSLVRQILIFQKQVMGTQTCKVN